MSSSITPATPVDVTTFDQVSQISHVIGGMLVVLGPIALFGPRYRGHWAVAFIILAALKEFWFDEIYEPANVRGSSAEDFLFYTLGVSGYFVGTLNPS